MYQINHKIRGNNYENWLENLENYKFIFKLIHKLLPTSIDQCATSDYKGMLLHKRHVYNTRNKKVLNLPRVKCKKYLDSIYCAGYRDFITLNAAIKNSPNLDSFVKQCKKLLISSNV